MRVTTESVDRVLSRLDQFGPTDPPEDLWDAFSSPDDWPPLFYVLSLAADVPRLDSSLGLSRSDSRWPALQLQASRVMLAQRMVAKPIILPSSIETTAESASRVSHLGSRLADDRCVHLSGLLPQGAQRADLEAAVASRATGSAGQWGQLTPEEAPELYRSAEQILSSPAFVSLTNFDPYRDQFSLTLSLQDLDKDGIAWHQDLYWPREWVQEDVFAVLYALADDTPVNGGAFLLYSAQSNQLSHIFRRAHDCTVLWNCRSTLDRPFHAVSRYRTAQTSRPLLILQCLRKTSPVSAGDLPSADTCV